MDIILKTSAAAFQHCSVPYLIDTVYNMYFNMKQICVLTVCSMTEVAVICYTTLTFTIPYLAAGGRWTCCGPCVSGEVSSSAKMRLTPGSPPPILPAILALTLAAFLPQLSSGATPFPQDLEPISIVGRECKFKKKKKKRCDPCCMWSKAF